MLDAHDRLPLPQDIERFLRGMLDELAPGRVSLTVDQFSQQEQTSFGVKPRNPAAAAMGFTVADDGAQISVRLGKVVEFDIEPPDGTYTDRGAIRELKSIVTSTVRGRFQESVWRHGDEIVKVHGRLVIDDGIREIGSYTNFIGWLRSMGRAIRTDYAYEPY